MGEWAKEIAEALIFKWPVFLEKVSVKGSFNILNKKQPKWYTEASSKNKTEIYPMRQVREAPT